MYEFTLGKSSRKSANNLYVKLESIRSNQALSKVKICKKIGIDTATYRKMNDGHLTNKTTSLVVEFLTKERPNAQ